MNCAHEAPGLTPKRTQIGLADDAAVPTARAQDLTPLIVTKTGAIVFE